MLKAIVSMTTISSRTAHLAGVIRRILDGSRRPDRLLLFISDQPAGIDRGLTPDALPNAVQTMRDHGEIEIYTVRNIGPYRKLVPALDHADDPDTLIVTADDDVAYPVNWLHTLEQTAASSPDAIVAYRARAIPKPQESTSGHPRTTSAIADYNQWQFARSSDHGLRLLPTGRGGVGYRRRHFTVDDIPRLERFRHLAPFQDDIALRCCTLLREIPVLTVDPIDAGSDKPEFDGFNYPDSLYKQNVLAHAARNRNDAAMTAILADPDGARLLEILAA